ncbi:MAG TPA: hypothetical protein DCX55_10730, partial [Erythrobacter sp.]|nr:hypothetical protein [Erythrobacter sp.]
RQREVIERSVPVVFFMAGAIARARRASSGSPFQGCKPRFGNVAAPHRAQRLGTLDRGQHR